MCPTTDTAALPLRGKVCGSEEMKSLLCFLGRTATYPSQCRSQIVCLVDLLVGCEPVRGLDSDCSNIYSRSQRPVRKGDGNQTSKLDFSHWTSQLRGQHLCPGFLPVCRLPLSLCLNAVGALRSPKVLGQGKCDKCWAAKGTWRADPGTALVGSNYNGYHVLGTYNYLYILPTSQLRSYSYYSRFIDQ